MPGLPHPSWPLPLPVGLLHPWPPTRTFPAKLCILVFMSVCAWQDVAPREEPTPPCPEQLWPPRQTNGVS